MATAKQILASKSTTINLSESEVTQLLAVLHKAEELVSASGTQQTQSFLGGLIKKIKRATRGAVKRAT